MPTTVLSTAPILGLKRPRQRAKRSTVERVPHYGRTACGGQLPVTAADTGEPLACARRARRVGSPRAAISRHVHSMGTVARLLSSRRPRASGLRLFTSRCVNGVTPRSTVPLVQSAVQRSGAHCQCPRPSPPIPRTPHSTRASAAWAQAEAHRAWINARCLCAPPMCPWSYMPSSVIRGWTRPCFVRCRLYMYVFESSLCSRAIGPGV